MLVFYLAHPIKVRYDIRKEELKIERELGIKLINPFYDPKGDEGEREDIRQINNTSKGAWDISLDYDKIVDADLSSIRSSYGIVAWVEKTVGTIGTYMEIWYAYSIGKPVYIISPDWYTHPWLQYVAEHSNGKIVKSFDELKVLLREIIKNG